MNASFSTALRRFGFLGMAGLVLFPSQIALQAQSKTVVLAAREQPRSTLVLRAAAEINGDELRLGDFLAETSKFEGEGQQISPSDVAAGISPPFGKTLTVRRTDLDAVLARVLPKDSYTWMGAKDCLISRPCTEIKEAQLVGMIESALRVFTNKEGELRIVRLLNYSPLVIPRDDAATEVDLVAPHTRSPFGSVMVDVNHQGKLHFRRNLRFEWEWKKPVWVAADAVGAGRAQPRLFNREDRNILTMPGEVVADDALPDDLMLSRAIAKGDPLLRSNVTSAVVVTRGAAVTAEVKSGLMLVSLKAVALESGSVGQTIRVQNTQSRKEILGKITHANTVEVIP